MESGVLSVTSDGDKYIGMRFPYNAPDEKIQWPGDIQIHKLARWINFH